EFVFTASVGEKPPASDLLGPVWARGPSCGMVLRDGCLVHQWGDVHRTDMTFSVAKSYLGLLTGLAIGDGLIELDGQVGLHSKDGGFDSEHNRKITWRH